MFRETKDWDRYVDALLFAYREAPQESLGFAPFEMLYGRTVNGPLQILKKLWTQEQDNPDTRTTYQCRGRTEQAPRHLGSGT